MTTWRDFDLERRGVIMGVVNVTPDSFSDGGNYLDPAAAVAHALELNAQGAGIIDIGGESTRPGAVAVTESEELRRVLPVIEQLAATLDIVISIDTRKAGVARAAVGCGARIINDISGLQEEAMRRAAVETGAMVIAMHMQGTPETMQRAPHYQDVTREIRDFFRQTFNSCIRSGMDPQRLAFDPGIGFGKTAAHNLTLLKNLDQLQTEGCPLCLGVSRKSFLAKTAGSRPGEDSLWPTVALTSFARTKGAAIFRVHDVRENLHALRMTEAILRS